MPTRSTPSRSLTGPRPFPSFLPRADPAFPFLKTSDGKEGKGLTAEKGINGGPGRPDPEVRPREGGGGGGILRPRTDVIPESKPPG